MQDMGWYPNEVGELDGLLKTFLLKERKLGERINGIIVPHAGYSYSGPIAGEAYSLLKNNGVKKAVIFGPSHYVELQGLASLRELKSPLGNIVIRENDMRKLDYEHSIQNQVPFLQKLGFEEVLPIVVGEISNSDAERYAEKFAKENIVFVFSTDLCHFLPYNQAVEIDKETIRIIEHLLIKKFENMDACGRFPLLIMMHLCKLKKWKPSLITYKNSGDITGNKSSVVGYASFWF
jgi:AmmeMemoRadiSam system protein B